MKQCSYCLEEKPLDEFYDFRRKSGKVSKQSRCKTCCRETQRARRPEDQQTFNRRSKLKNTYGLSLEDYERMLAEQFGVCAICGTNEPGGRFDSNFCVDHDHATGEVRGLLCTNCNLGLGKFKDDADVLELAIAYLRRHSAAQPA